MFRTNKDYYTSDDVSEYERLAYQAGLKDGRKEISELLEDKTRIACQKVRQDTINEFVKIGETSDCSVDCEVQSSCFKCVANRMQKKLQKPLK